MKRSDTSNSIMMLKHKFDEIKQNICNIEERQREFFTKSPHHIVEDLSSSQLDPQLGSLRSRTLEATIKQYERPASAARYGETSNDRLKELENNNKYLMRMIKTLEQNKEELLGKVDSLQKENDKLKDELVLKNSKITVLTNENQQLKSRVETNEKRNQSPMRAWEADNNEARKCNSEVKARQPLGVRQCNSEIKERPSSCMRSGPSPKKQRVAFSKDLVKIVHIDGDECPRSIEKLKNNEIVASQVSYQNPYSRYSSPGRLDEQFNSTTPVEKTNIDYTFNGSAKKYDSYDKAYGRDSYKPVYTSLQDKRALFNKLNSEEYDQHFSEYYRERSRIIAQKMIEMD
ncbi:unnamed protein product [Blepharisma stoltei]|uniref:Uncharacterized protein n=1 Tax=Blepharisma stoltei TaxID=1481888 RepID=A0AAU9K4N8_9CILI|nr:unnamed protein product [Blepharisma stoltei]